MSKRIRAIGAVGLCLAAAMALSAVGASPAIAGEYGKCVQTAKVGKLYRGRYLNKECTKEASKAEQEAGGKKNKYEWGSAAGTKFTDSTKSAAVSNAYGGPICKSSTSTGEITGWTTGTDRITFHDCEINVTKGKCTSIGETEGEIETFPLKTYLLDHGTKGQSGLEPKEGEAWTELLAEPSNPKGKGVENAGEPLVSEYTCAPGFLVETSGTLSGVTTPLSKMEDKFSWVFGSGKGEQDWKMIAFEPSEANMGPTTLTTTATVENDGKAKTEIRACNEKGATSGGGGLPACEHEEEV